MRRTWFKMYSHQILYGSMMEELDPKYERWIWVGLLCICSDCPYQPYIKETSKFGYTDEQFADKLDVPLKVWMATKEKLASPEIKKIRILKNNVVKILNWTKYQSEYQRQKQYREKEIPGGKSDKEKLQIKVTVKSDTLDIDIDIDKDKELISKDINFLFKAHKTNVQKSYAEIEKEFEELWKVWPSKAGMRTNKPDAKLAYFALRRKVGKKIITRAFHGYMDFLKYQKEYNNFDQNPSYPASWLRKNKWASNLFFKYGPKL